MKWENFCPKDDFFAWTDILLVSRERDKNNDSLHLFVYFIDGNNENNYIKYTNALACKA